MTSDIPAARIRGDIQQGRTGDKVPGFDPAMAPLETDAEAGGATQPVLEGERTAARPPPGANASETGSAMRPFNADMQTPRRALSWKLYGMLGIVALLIVLALVA